MTPDLTDSIYWMNCDECGSDLEYQGNTTTPRDDVASEFRCPDPDCPEDEVIRR